MMSSLRLGFLLPLLLAPLGAQTPPPAARPAAIALKAGDDDFLTYCTGEGHGPRPFCFPVLGVGGARMNRLWPVDTSDPAEQKDHVHHRGLWFTHGDVNGHDFWTDDAKSSGSIVTKELAADADGLGLRARSEWRAATGGLVCVDERRLRVRSGADWRILDFEVTVKATETALRFGDTKEGTMALRLADVLAMKGKGATGHYENSEGIKDAAAWGKRAAWVDAFGQSGGRTVGVAIFDHPSNPNHPCWWHARDYGLFAANPFGAHDFEGKPKGAGDVTVDKGAALSFRYRFYFHAGATADAKVAERYAEYASKGDGSSK